MPTNIESLPDELLFDILVRLAADYLFDAARFVCRKWYHIIHSHAFVNTQIRHSTCGLLVSSLTNSGYSNPIYVTAAQGRVETSELSYTCSRGVIKAGCNGLAVEIHHRDSNSLSLRVINPATKQSFLLPSSNNINVCHGQCGIAYSAASMEYKVTLLSDVGFHIVTVGVDKSWRHVQIHHLFPEHLCLLYCYPLSTEGFLHWGILDYVLTLNVETEVLTASQLPLPPKPYCHKMRNYYLSTERHLSVIVARGDFSWEVWEMKPETGEWRKLQHNIELEPQKCRLQQFASRRDQFLKPLGWVKYPEILAFCFSSIGRACIVYNLDTHETNTIELPGSGGHYSAFAHRNNLVWLT